jgi:hypothetical protein
MVARAGRDGASLTLRGPYDVNAKYTKFDIVTFGGEPFFALRDAPGLCPGEGWQRLSPRGEKGAKGERGPRGSKDEKGAPGPAIESWGFDKGTVSRLAADDRRHARGDIGTEVAVRGVFSTDERVKWKEDQSAHLP